MIGSGECFAPDRSLRPPRPCPDVIRSAKSSVSSQSTLLQSAISGHGLKPLNERQVAAGGAPLPGKQAQTERIENAILTEQHVSPVLIKNSAETSFRSAQFRRRSWPVRKRACVGRSRRIVRNETCESLEQFSEMKAAPWSGAASPL